MLRVPNELTRDLLLSHSLMRCFQFETCQVETINIILNDLFSREGVFSEYEILMEIMPHVLSSKENITSYRLFFQDFKGEKVDYDDS